ncbi:unnamed protein product [Hymenolepis diminuta]|uniref:DUF5727 domain-containing protein n=1 Tax=Hymenolepis diminuta TaxID=6216 RepID=A0A564YCG7_HYMDI|nr:unnamed protein product [Hymenolepis diminuta]
MSSKANRIGSGLEGVKVRTKKITWALALCASIDNLTVDSENDQLIYNATISKLTNKNFETIEWKTVSDSITVTLDWDHKGEAPEVKACGSLKSSLLRPPPENHLLQVFSSTASIPQVSLSVFVCVLSVRHRERQNDKLRDAQCLN